MVVPVVPVILANVAPGEAVVNAVLHAVHEGAGDVVVLGHAHARLLDNFCPARHVAGLVSGISYRSIHVVNLKKWEISLVFLLHLFARRSQQNVKMTIRKTGKNNTDLKKDHRPFSFSFDFIFRFSLLCSLSL